MKITVLHSLKIWSGLNEQIVLSKSSINVSYYCFPALTHFFNYEKNANSFISSLIHWACIPECLLYARHHARLLGHLRDTEKVYPVSALISFRFWTFHIFLSMYVKIYKHTHAVLGGFFTTIYIFKYATCIFHFNMLWILLQANTYHSKALFWIVGYCSSIWKGYIMIQSTNLLLMDIPIFTSFFLLMAKKITTNWNKQPSISVLFTISFISKWFLNMDQRTSLFLFGTDQTSFSQIVANHLPTSVCWVPLLHSSTCTGRLQPHGSTVVGENGILMTFPGVEDLCLCVLAVCIFSSVSVHTYSCQSLRFWLYSLYLLT